MRIWIQLKILMRIRIELKILMRIRIQIRGGGGGGGRSAKNLHPPWQNPRYAPVQDPPLFTPYQSVHLY
jgi:hypothetical protein